MKISFVIPSYNRKFGDLVSSHTHLPLGVLYTAAILEKYNIEVEVSDLRVEDNFPNNFFQDTNLIVLVFNTYEMAQCFDYDPLFYVKKTIKNIKLVSSAPIYCCGSIPTWYPDEIINLLNINGCFIGEYENSIPSFILGLKKDENLKLKEKIIHPKIKLNLLDLPLPSYHLVNLSLYGSEGVIENEPYLTNTSMLLNTRGCNYSCNFCHHKFFEFNYRNENFVLNEMEFILNNYKINKFFFLDYIFNNNYNRGIDICRCIIDKKLNVSWVCQTRIELLDNKIIEIMSNSGCKGIWLGIEDPFDSKKYNKTSLSYETVKTLENLKNNNIIPFIFFMIDSTDENSNIRIKEILNWVEANNVYFTVSCLYIRPSTKLYEELNLNSFNDMVQHNNLRRSKFQLLTNLKYIYSHPNYTKNLPVRK